MCGIAGYVLNADASPSVRRVRSLLQAISSRGPDDEGVAYACRSTGAVSLHCAEKTAPGPQRQLPHYASRAALPRHDVGLLHARYSIIDLSPAAHQPFVSQDRSIVAILNGEIYNYIELRDELRGHGVAFRSASDTEVLVEGYRVWRDDLWPKLNGFWAVALFDATTRSVVLSRDRLGIAPLYYRETEEGVFFASAILPLTAIHPKRTKPNPEVVQGFIETSMKDFGNDTCFESVRVVPAATVVKLPEGVFRVSEGEHSTYWSLPSDPLSPADLSLADAVAQYRELFIDAVKIRLRADVPVAFELSGGLDSSSIVGAAAALGRDDITAYTIRVPEADEEPFARSVCRRHGITHRVLDDVEDTFADDAGGFAAIMEEPYHSPNIYTHYRMRRLMKAAGVSVVLSGSGGDEVLAGYEHLLWPKARADLIRRGRLTAALGYELSRSAGTAAGVMRAVRERAQWLARGVRRHGTRPWAYVRRRIESFGQQSPPAHETAPSRAERLHHGFAALSSHEQRLYQFRVGLLPYYLMSNDRFTMAIPIEQRFPFLDYRLVEFGLRLPVEYLFRNGWSKYVLRKAMAPFLPSDVVWRRRKFGFPFPHRRFLKAHATAFAPLVDRVVKEGLVRNGALGYQEALASDPTRLWRICATGLWLEMLSPVMS